MFNKVLKTATVLSLTLLATNQLFAINPAIKEAIKDAQPTKEVPKLGPDGRLLPTTPGAATRPGAAAVLGAEGGLHKGAGDIKVAPRESETKLSPLEAAAARATKQKEEAALGTLRADLSKQSTVADRDASIATIKGLVTNPAQKALVEKALQDAVSQLYPGKSLETLNKAELKFLEEQASANVMLSGGTLPKDGLVKADAIQLAKELDGDVIALNNAASLIDGGTKAADADGNGVISSSELGGAVDGVNKAVGVKPDQNLLLTIGAAKDAHGRGKESTRELVSACGTR